MKRSHDAKIQYAVMETKEDDSSYVQFMPQSWLVASEENPLKERAVVQFLYPRRLPKQSKHSYLKFIKNATLICMSPRDDGKWERREGRILKLGLGDLEAALDAQKLYSDYFSTTEAEKEFADRKTAERKCIRKKKKPRKVADQIVDQSESDEDEISVMKETNAVSNYTADFVSHTQNSMAIAPTVYAQITDSTTFGSQDFLFPLENILTSDDALLESTNEIFAAINVPVFDGTNIQLLESNCETHNQMDLSTPDDNEDQHNDNTQVVLCKTHQKALNKIDYLHKKFNKEFSALHQAVNANRQLILQVLKVLQSLRHSDEQVEYIGFDETDHGQTEPAKLDAAEIAELDKKYKSIFPVKDWRIIVDFNKDLKDDPKFADFLSSKMSGVCGADVVKAARKFLKELFHFECLKDFTWHGTKKGL